MKKTILTLSAVIVLSLSACTSTAPATNPAAASKESTTTGAAVSPLVTASQDTNAPTGFASSDDSAASELMQLLVGTLSLTGDQTVTGEQKGVLLPLWTELRTLSTSRMPGPGTPDQANATPQPQSNSDDTQAQIDALVNQIRAAMTPEQLEAIEAMKITQDSVIALMQEQGIGMGRGQGGDGAAQSPQGAPAGRLPSGQQPPSGGQQPGDGQALSDLPQLGDGTSQPPQRAPAGGPPGGGRQPSGGVMGRGGMVPPQMIDAVIQALGGEPASAPSAAGPDASTGASVTISALYSQDGGTETKTGGDFVTPDDDQTAIYVTGGGVLTLTNATIETSGNTSSADDSSLHGLNAAVLAAGASTITLSDSSISTTGSGANGAFATEAGSTVNLNRVTIEASGDGGHAVMATNGGMMTLTDVDMTTAGKNSGAVATDRGGGTITVTGGSLANTAATGPLFYVNNSTGVITLKNVKVTAASGILVDASANSRWGDSGSNGGNVILTADSQTLAGDLTADNVSTITARLQYGSTLTGAINAAATAKTVDLTLDASSIWNVTADSTLTCLNDTYGILDTAVTNITGNGHTVTYDASACPALGGKTYALNGGGALQPAG